MGLVSLAAEVGGGRPIARAAQLGAGAAENRQGAESPSQVVAPPGGDRAHWEELPRIGVGGLSPLGVDRRDRFWVSSEEGYHYWTGQAWHRWQPNDVVRMWHDRQGHSPGRHSYTFEACIGGRMYFERYRPRRIYRLSDDSDNVELVCLMPEPANHRGCRIGPSGRVWRINPDRVSLYAPPPRSEAVAAARELAGGLIDDRPEMREATAARIIALGFDAIEGLDAARRPKLPELDVAIDGLVKRMLDAEEMFQHGPWKHWPRHSDLDVPDAYVAVTDHADNFYLISQTESLWFRRGELAGRFDHEAMPVQNFHFYGLASGVVLCGQRVPEGEPPVVWNFQAKRIGGGIPKGVKHVAWIPDGLLEDTERLKHWLWMYGAFNDLSGPLADGWLPEEITARRAAPACKSDPAQAPYPVSAARPGEAVAARYADRTQVLRGGKLYEIDWRDGVMPVAGRVFVDSRGVYWLSDRRRVVRYWPGPPGASPVPSGKPSDRFEVVPLRKSLAAQDRQGAVYVFRKEDQGDVSRWHDGRWQRVTEGLRPPKVKYGGPCGAGQMFVDDLGRVYLRWNSRQTTIWTRVQSKQIDRFPTATEMLADSYRTGSRWFSINIVVLEDGLWLPERCVRSGAPRAIRHFDGKRWHEVVRDVDADRPAYGSPDFVGLFVLPDGHLVTWPSSSSRKTRLDIIDRTTHIAHTVPTLDGVSVHTPDGRCPAWPADGTPAPEGAVVVVTDHHGHRWSYGAADFNTYGARGCEERLAKGLPPELATMQTLWRRLSGRLRQGKHNSGTCLAGARRWARGFAIPFDLSQTPAAGLFSPLITVAAEDEIWAMGARRKRFAYPDSPNGRSSNIGYDLVRWKSTPIQATARWKDGKGRVVQLGAARDGKPAEVLGYLWQVDEEPWRIWRSTRPLDLSFLDPDAKKLRAIAVSWDGRGLSEPIEMAIPARD